MEFKDNSAAVLAQLEKNKLKVLNEIGLHWQRRAVELATDNAVVDTGRYRASLSFITPDKESGRNKSELKPGKDGKPPVSKASDALSGRSDQDTVTVGSNVDYAVWIEEGARKRHKRPVVGNAILYYKDEYEQIAKRTLGEGFEVSAGDVVTNRR